MKKSSESITYLPVMSDGIVSKGVLDKGLRWRSFIACEVNRREFEFAEFVNHEDPIQVAIFELEGAADTKDLWVQLSDLANAAWREVLDRYPRRKLYPAPTLKDQWFEAAALLRDGWRPEGYPK